MYWLDHDCQSNFDNYSRVSTCLALSKAVYAPDDKACVSWLDQCKDDMRHGIEHVLFSVHCERQYLIAIKPRTKEIYVTFRGTESWKALLISFRIYAQPNDIQGMFYAGYHRQAQMIPLAPFFYLLKKYSDYKLIFNGHSLGGGIAAIVTVNMLSDLRAMDLKERIHCVSFGSPFIADEACAKYIDDRYRINFQFYVNHNDFVPYLLSLIYGKSLELLEKKRLWDSCEEWLQYLGASVMGGEMDVGIFGRFLRRIGLRQMRTHAELESNCCRLGSYLIETCCHRLLEFLPMYEPFGCYFGTKCVRSTSESDAKFYVEKLSLDKFCQNISQCSLGFIGGITCSVQDHYIKSYITEIHTNVIRTMEQDGHISSPSVKLLADLNDFDTCPLSMFLLPKKELWTWKHPSLQAQNDDFTHYMWSIVSSRCEDKEEITLRIYGPAVSFITGLKCENSIYAQKALEPEDYWEESVRIFILYLPFKQNSTADDYPFYIVSHFGTVNLKSLFNPTNFTQSLGMQGRRKQVADLNILELYKLAFAYCTFTGDDIKTDDADPNTARRRDVKKHLLRVEKLLSTCSDELMANNLNRLTDEQLNQLSKEISFAASDRLSNDRLCVSDEEMSTISTGCMASIYGSKPSRSKLSVFKRSVKDIKTVMDKWFENRSIRQTEALNMTDVCELTCSTTDTIVEIIPRLFSMSIAITTTLASRFDLRKIKWEYIGLATIGGFILGLAGAAYMIPVVIGYITGGVVGGVAGGGTVGIFQLLKPIHVEYLTILGVIAQSLGVVLDHITIHAYPLEEKISKIYRTRLYHLQKEYIYHEWSNLFPGGIFNKVTKHDQQDHCLRIIECIDANFQMRILLSQDFALGVVGPGKTGKSTLVRCLFGFDTNPDREIRTKDLRSYQVNRDFRIVDFPHMTSVFESVRNCFICNHTLVNAIIVVLNAEQGGNDRDGEGNVVRKVKELRKRGVHVLFCFNQCDKLALKQKALRKQCNIDKFSAYDNGVIPSRHTTTQENLSECWTQDHVKKKKEVWSKNYDLDPDECWMTFCDLEETDEIKSMENYHKLRAIQLYTYSDIKTIWLRNVLEQNGLSNESIEEIMQYRYEEPLE